MTQTSDATEEGAHRPSEGVAISAAKGLAKTYQMGEVEVTALVDVDLTIVYPDSKLKDKAAVKLR